MNRFDTSYIKYLHVLRENSIRRVGFFPGCFSPPHKGHYMTAKQMGVENDYGYIIASDSCRDPYITTEKMITIWKIYIEAMNLDNVVLKVVPGSPVGVTYQAVNLINNDKLVTKKPVDVHTDAKNIYDQVNSKQVSVSLYAGQEDFNGRYSAFFNAEDNVYTGRNVANINKKQVGRYASGTDTRNTIHDIAIGVKDADTLRSFLPGASAGNEFTGDGFLTTQQEDQIVDILLS